MEEDTDQRGKMKQEGIRRTGSQVEERLQHNVEDKMEDSRKHSIEENIEDSTEHNRR